MHIDPRDRVWVSSTSSVHSKHRLMVMEYDSDGNLARLLHREAEDSYTGDAIAFDPQSNTLLIAGVRTEKVARANGGLFGDEQGRPAQPAAAKPGPPHYFIMRLPLLEDLPEPAQPEE